MTASLNTCAPQFHNKTWQGLIKSSDGAENKTAGNSNKYPTLMHLGRQRK